MNRRRRADSAASKDLLSRQLASITDTLAKASQRRDAELKKVQCSAGVSPATAGPASVSEPAVPVNKPDQTHPTPAAAQLDATAATASDLCARKHATGKATNFDAHAATVHTYGTSDVGDDARADLGEPESLRDVAYMSDSQSNDDGDGDIEQMLVELDKSASPPLTIAVGPTDDDPQQMLAELAALPATDRREVSSLTNEDDDGDDDDDDDDDDDINVLRMRLEDLRSELNIPLQMASRNPTHVDKTTGHYEQEETIGRLNTRIDPEVIPYVIALELEHSCHAQGWTTYQYSSSLDGYEACKDKEIAVARAEDALKNIVYSVLELEEGFRRKEEEMKLYRRLVVSNLAAGADVQELELLFCKQRLDIVNIALLPDRDPLRRTQTAHINMSSRKAAIQASYMTGQVYGLIVHVRLAVEQGV